MNFIVKSALIVVGAILPALPAAGCVMFFDVPSTPLHEAAWRGDIDAVRRVVKAGADINAPDSLGGTALYWAARGGHALGPHRCRGEAENWPAVMAALLDLGANPNLRDRRPRIPGGSSGWTPLFVALHHEQFKSAAVLLEHGADPNLRSDQGLSVMEMASDEGAPRMLLELIMAKGFDPQLAHRPD
ncbi:MAG: ankyrin repeat domain-containing protein [Vicinamibacterales bacterium]